MLSASVRSHQTKDLGDRTVNSVRRGLRDAADAGFSVSFDEAPSGGSTTLKHSAFEPEWSGNTLKWGFGSDYAEAVEDGSRPHWIPVRAMPDVEVWARRVLGDEAAAWAVRHKIAEEGTDAQPFVEPGFDVMVREVKDRGLSRFIDAELRGTFSGVR